MTIGNAQKPSTEHNHKVVLLYASHRHILRPTTFRLLHQKSLHDSTLHAFLQSGYQSLRHEARHEAGCAAQGCSSPPVLPDAFEGLSEATANTVLSFYVISLTTLAQIGVVLATRQDFKDALSHDFPAIWDPESFLTAQVLQASDVSSSLDLIVRSLEAIRLATCLDVLLSPGNFEEKHGRLQRLTIRGSKDGTASVLDRCSNEGDLVQETLCGFALGALSAPESEWEQRVHVPDMPNDVLITERSRLPLVDKAQWVQFEEKLQATMRRRGIAVGLEADTTTISGEASTFSVDLKELFLQSDNGRSTENFHSAIEQLKQLSDLSRIYGPAINLLLLGGSATDACLSAVTRHLESHAMPHEQVKLLNLLSPKDAQRFGDEPVKLSKVRGNPCEQVAIVGMSCRVPGASDADELWKLLKAGKDTCEEIPERLYRYQAYHSASYRDRNVMRVRTGNFLSCPSLFDPSLIGGLASADDCAKMDPQQRVAILTAHEALQKAGYGFSARHPPKQPRQWSTHLAYCSDDYREHLSHDIDGTFVANTHRAHLVARVNETFGFRGDACTYDTACSSALVAVEAACSSLLARECSAVLTGGINIITQPQITIGLDRGFFLSPASQCMTLDDAGAGYSRADAVSIMLLKRLPDAVRDGDPILAVISSAATNHSGESFSITHPHGETQRRLYQAGMLASGTLPRDFSYIEMHGTGTQSGDFEEVTGIVDAFGGDRRLGEPPLVLGSVKANVGHSEATSGATSMIKTIQIYNHGVVPRHIGIRTKLNTKLPPLDGLHVPLQETGLDNLATSFTLVDNFSAAGGNSSIVMDPGSAYRERLQRLTEASKQMVEDNGSGAKQHLLVVTAATPFSLDAKRRQLIAFLEQNLEISLTEFCSAVSLSDPMYSFRLISTPSTLAEAKACLSSQESVCTNPRRTEVVNVGIAFSGQGAQYLDMAKELYQDSIAFRRHVDGCNTIALSLGLPSLAEVIHPGYSSEDTKPSITVQARAADDFSPAQYQLALVAIEVSLMSMLRDWGLRPACVVGHSLGEYTALWTAGVLSLHSLIDLVGHRALLMMERCVPNATTMLAIRLHHAQVEELLRESGFERLETACINSPNDTVVAGSTEEIEKLMRLCEQKEPKIKAMAIPVPYAFHSRAVEPLMDSYAEVVARHRFSKPKVMIASNVLGKVLDHQSEGLEPPYLVRHLRNPVRFSESIEDLQGKVKVDTWIEVGPHPTCIPMLKGCYSSDEHPPAFLASFRRGSSSWSSTLGLFKELASLGIDLDREKAFADLGLSFCHRGLSARLPLYPFDLEEYWLPFKDRGLRDHLTAPANVSGIEDASSSGASPVREVPSLPRLPKPTHALLSQCVKLEADPPSALFLARTHERPFCDMIKGHIILGTPLAPATVFVELAQEAGMYWWRMDPKSARTLEEAEEDVAIEVMELSMVASLYLNERDPKQSIEVTLQGDPWSHDGSIVQFFSHSQHRHQKHQYGSCRIRIVRVEDIDRDWTKLAHLIKTAAAQVQASSTSVIKTRTVYRNFEAIVLYLGGFRGMETVWLTEGGDEAVSEVGHNVEAAHGRFLCSPMLLDSLGGLTGFISNVRFADGGYVYMADGIGRIVTMPGLRKLQPGSPAKVRVYARMEQENDLSKGDAYFFLPDGQLMGMMERIVFKRIRRDMLIRLVQLSSKAFNSEAERAAQAQGSAERQSEGTRARAPAGGSSKAIAGPASKMHRNVPEQVGFLPEPSRESPMDELTDPNKRLAASKPLHIAGPQLKHFGGRDVLFLFPDGSGTARTYPSIDTGGRLSIYGFDSPYLGRIGAWSRGVGELVDQYIEILRRAQPQGPYRLGGWSIGGIIALELARRLLSLGHEVAFLALIDTPSPRQIKPLPADTLEEMLGRITSATVREHFRSCALSLPGYRCLAFAPADAKPARIAVVNAAADSALRGVMADEREWRSFWSDAARLAWHEVPGDHWSCLEPALGLVVESAL